MRPILTSSQKAAAALRRAETALRNWQDDPDSPRSDVDDLLRRIAEMRDLVQAHVWVDVEHAHERMQAARAAASSATAHTRETSVAETVETYHHEPRDAD